MGRSVVAVVAGYLVFGVSAALLFALSGADPHLAPSRGFLIISILYAIGFSMLAGYVAAALAPRAPLLHAAIVAIIIAAIALVSLLLERHRGAVWSEVVTLVTAWNALMGGYHGARRRATRVS